MLLRFYELFSVVLYGIKEKSLYLRIYNLYFEFCQDCKPAGVKQVYAAYYITILVENPI